MSEKKRRPVWSLVLSLLAISMLVWAVPVVAGSEGKESAWDEAPAGYAVARTAGNARLDWGDAPIPFGLTQMAGAIRVNWADAPISFALIDKAGDVAKVRWDEAPMGFATIEETAEMAVRDAWDDAPAGFAMIENAGEPCVWLDAPAGVAIKPENAALGLAFGAERELLSLCLADSGLALP